MKKNLLFLASFFVCLGLSGQDHHAINFAGVNANPETVLVRNLTQDTELTIQGSDVLHLMIKGVSVDELPGLFENGLVIYPNPFEHSCKIEFANLRRSKVAMQLYDISGRLIHQFSDELSEGQHTFLLTGVPSGSYLLKVQTSTGLLSGKFFVIGQTNGAFSLQHINEVPLKTKLNENLLPSTTAGVSARSGRTVVEMDFWPGDQMLFVGNSDGFDNIGIYDNPDGDHIYTFEFTNWWPAGYEHCFVVPTAVVEVTNPATGKVWMDRNLGASQAATSSTDAASYGDLYQWGRFADGHQCPNSQTNSTLSNSDQPGHGNFILGSNNPWDWRSPQNDNLWQGVNGDNIPCPNGFRLPTEAELIAEAQSWESNNSQGAYASPLKLPLAGRRSNNIGVLNDVGSSGYCWSGTISETYSRFLDFGSNSAGLSSGSRAGGRSVRCIKDIPPSVSTSEVSEISNTTAISGGNVTSDGGTPVTARGVVWSISENPTLASNLGSTSNGTGTGEFTSEITDLTATTTYYVRAYATNSAGTNYGQEVSFTTSGGSSGEYPAGFVHCGTPTAVVDVTNPATGKTWMDRNLGASQVATSSTDAASYGDLYQWGRFADGHQCRNSPTTTTLSNSDQPGHGSFILASDSPMDWRSPQNTNLWQGLNQVNNPCPGGYRLPTEAELNAERQSWDSNNSAGAFASPLKLPMAGRRHWQFGSLIVVGSGGRYWSSTVFGSNARELYFITGDTGFSSIGRAGGDSVRCLKD